MIVLDNLKLAYVLVHSELYYFTQAFVCRWMNQNALQPIHPDSQENVNATRSQLGIVDVDGDNVTDQNASAELQVYFHLFQSRS